MGAAFTILYDVVAFRVRRLEMANLAAAVAVMLVLRLPWEQIALRTTFAALLNALVYLNNDYFDLALDTQTPGRDAEKAAYLHAHRDAARAMQAALLVALCLLALWRVPDLLWVLLGGFGICFAYSAWLKRKPLLDVLAMALWGVFMPLSGSPLDRTLGLCLALQLGLFSAVFEVIQVIRDHDSDARLKVRTTAVALGVPRTLRLGRLLMVLGAVYAALVLHPVAGALALLAAFVPMRPRGAERYWTLIKLIYGIAWLVACGATFAAQQSGGLWLRVGVDARF